MAKKSGMVAKLVNILVWLTGVIVSLAVGLALVNGSLSVPYIGVANAIAGWIVVVSTVLGAILALTNK